MNKKIINKNVSKIAPSGIREFFDLVLSLDDVISLGVGEPDFVTPWNICEQAIFNLEKGYTSYTSNKGLKELRVEISKHLKNIYSLEYDPEKEILITTGVSEAFDLAVRSLIEPGDKVIVPIPSYVSYIPIIQLAGGIPILLKTQSSDSFRINADKLSEICKTEKNIKAFIINYPSNPTGCSYTKKQIYEISKVVEKYNLIVISDEIYDRISYDFKHTPFPSLKGMKKRTVYLNGFSKSYAMTGWRIGYACGDYNIISSMNKIHQYTMLCAPIMSQMAAIEALQNSQNSVKTMVKEYKTRKLFLMNKLSSLGFKCNNPQGAFYLYPNIEDIYNNSVDFARDLVRKEKVAVVPGVAFGPGGEKFIRVSYASNLSKLKEAVLRIERFLSKSN